MGRNGKNTPLYVHIHRNLREEILSGKHTPGSPLPSENSLCQQYNTSRFTVRSSLKKLDEEGLVRNLPGRGWEVLKSDGRSIRRKNSALAFIGRGDTESAQAFESIRKSYGIHFTELKYHMKGMSQDPSWYDEFIQHEVATGRCNAVIIFDDKPLPENFVLQMKSAEIPFVCLPLNGSYQYDNIGTDNLGASGMMLDYLFSKGHRNIIFATCRGLDGIPSFTQRRNGYSMAMEKHGLKPEIIMADQNFWQGPEEERMLLDRIALMKSEGRNPTCIFSSVHVPAIEFLSVLKRHSIKVPEEISLCSFGCSPEASGIVSKFGIRKLTHIEEQFDVMGAVALEVLSMKGKTSMPVSTLVPIRLVEGDSVACINR